MNETKKVFKRGFSLFQVKNPDFLIKQSTQKVKYLFIESNIWTKLTFLIA